MRYQLAAFPVQINPGFDYYFVDNATFFSLDVNALYEFALEDQLFTPYAGAGLIYSRVSVDDIETGFGSYDASDSDVGLNLVGGATFHTGNLKPFVQAKVKLAGDYDLLTLGGGLLFDLSH